MSPPANSFFLTVKLSEQDSLKILFKDYIYLRPPHTRRFFVVELQIFCRGQIRLKFVGPSVRRTLADFLPRLTALRLGAGSFKIKTAPIPLT